MHWLENWIVPPKCVLTNEGALGLDLSANIVEGFKRPQNVCPQCCEPSIDGELCGACITQPPSFDRTQVGFYFEEELVELVHALKYQNQVAYARLLAELMIEHIDVQGVELLLPVPIHSLRWRERGFNQAELIAKSLGHELGLPVATNVIQRQKSTLSQTGLTATSRMNNLKGAFSVNIENLQGISKIALVDDVITTGATMSAIASTIKKSMESIQVEAWAVAKTK